MGDRELTDRGPQTTDRGQRSAVVLITGATGNLGAAAARAFYAAGDTLALFARKPDKVTAVLPVISADGERAAAFSVDMSDPDSIESGVQAVIANFGRVDVLVNTVGGYRAGTPVHETPLETWEFMQALNARAAFLISRAVVPHMLAQKSGKIIHVAARPGLKGARNAAAYSAAKSAVIRLTESLSAEVKEAGINVNCILPGTIDTPQNRAAMPTADFSRWVAPEALAAVIRFLASADAAPIHGAAIPAYGLS
ncbi:MAG: SDR family NAD(P)-dependent oxidoreductase [Anaerolineae bacterium]|nr:MAG: SDR family NAD(P)-dependent oxidoreductase [Anaerolineae bacterium]